MKRWKITALLLCFLLLMSSVCVWADAAGSSIPADRQMERLVDRAGLLTESEEKKLLQKLNEISEKQQCDVAIVTVDSLEGKSAKDYADDFYDYNGYGMGAGDDGILLPIAMNSRDWAVSTYGFGIRAFTDAGQDYIMDQVLPDLSDGDYAEAFSGFADLCSDFLAQARSGKAYDVGNMPKKPLSLLWIPGALGIGAAIALIILQVMKSSLKTVTMKQDADQYIRPGSMVLSKKQDRFMYSHVSKTEIPRDTGSSGGGSSTHTSSSGRSHGGSSGKF